MLGIRRIVGKSMEPSLVDGSFVLYLKTRWLPPALKNQLLAKSDKKSWNLLVCHAELGKIVKRCQHYDAEKSQIWLKGTHPSSTSTEQMGPVAPGYVEGIVLSTVSTPYNMHSKRSF